jgi:site-specific DNA-methyltransferase (adenine-specific)
MRKDFEMSDVTLKADDACEALAKIPNDTIDGGVIDPPYGKKVQRFKWDKILPPLRVWEETYRVLKPGAHIAVFCFPDMAHRLAIDLENVGFEIRNVWVWDYGHGTPISRRLTDELDARLRPRHESIVVARKKLDCPTVMENIEKWGTGGLRTRDTLGEGMRSYTIFEYGKPTDWERDLGADALPMRPVLEKPRKTGAFHKGEVMRRNNHYCVKPVALLTHLLKVVAKPGDTVIDPFMGSGSAGMAAVWAGMNYIGVDMNAHFVNIAKERIA